MLLQNLSIIGREGKSDIRVEAGKIRVVSKSGYRSDTSPAPGDILFKNAIAFPGLINSHDHLQFNLFEQYGDKTYRNYVEWGMELNLEYKTRIEEVLKISEATRTEWGIYKNLLNGFTTVVNHGEPLKIQNTLINVIQPNSLHSVQFEKNWRWKINRPSLSTQPLAVHVGEGTDESSLKEIDQLIQYNLFNRDLIGIHAVAMKEYQAAAFKSLVWCPSSNYFLLNQTADIHKLRHHTKIIFGSDSTLTSPWNLWDHLRTARKTKMVSDQAIYEMVTCDPAIVWGLQNFGSIEAGFNADLVVARQARSGSNWDSFFEVGPESILLVIQNGKVRLFDEELFSLMERGGLAEDQFGKIVIQGKTKYVAGALTEIIKEINYYHPNRSLPIALA